MRYTLENDVLKVEIESFGAELKSVVNKATGEEYMWCGDSKFWGRTSPVLFPFVGSLKNKEFFVDGVSYPMGQHGFARDMEHELVSNDGNVIWFKLSSDEETLGKFPFEFVLMIGYELKDNGVKVLWKVSNPGDRVLPFSIGAHPAFNCPVNGEESKTGYKIGFGDVSEIHHHGNTRDTGLATMDEDIVLPLTGGICEISEGFFDRCTYMIEGNQTGTVSLIDKSGRDYVTVKFDTPLFAIWSPEEKNAPFVCIEPWFGRCDATDFAGDIYSRDYVNLLNPGENFETAYQMIFK